MLPSVLQEVTKTPVPALQAIKHIFVWREILKFINSNELTDFPCLICSYLLVQVHRKIWNFQLE